MAILTFYTSPSPSSTLSRGVPLPIMVTTLLVRREAYHHGPPFQGIGDGGEAVASTLADIGAQDSRLANTNSLARGSKVRLSIIVGADNLRRELGTFYYILTGLFGYACPYVRELKGIVEWAASNQDAFERAISNSHLATALLDDVSRLLSEYLNTCVQASCTRDLTQTVSLTPVSFLHLRSELKFLPYHGIARLHPTL